MFASSILLIFNPPETRFRILHSLSVVSFALWKYFLFLAWVHCLQRWMNRDMHDGWKAVRGRGPHVRHANSAAAGSSSIAIMWRSVMHSLYTSRAIQARFISCHDNPSQGECRNRSSIHGENQANPQATDTTAEEVTLSFARSCADVLEFGIARVIDLGSDPARARRER